MARYPRQWDKLDPVKLRQLYWGERIGQREVAERLGVTRIVVRKAMKHHDIETRARGENMRRRYQAQRQAKAIAAEMIARCKSS